MQATRHSTAFLKQRKFMMVVPLLVVPFVTIVFAVLGGGKGTGGQLKDQRTSSGLNLQLPDAHFVKVKQEDKLSFYEQANKDSISWKAAIKNDPFYHHQNENEVKDIFEKNAAKFKQKAGLNASFDEKGDEDPNEMKVIEKLTLLKNEITKKQSHAQLEDAEAKNLEKPQAIKPSNTEKLEHLMAVMNTQKDGDPEIEQLNGLLDKILKIQQPEKKDSDQSVSEYKPISYEVHTGPSEADSIRMDSLSDDHNGFYELSDNTTLSIIKKNQAIEAVIHETQTLFAGSTVKLRLTSSVFINGVEIPSGQFVYGTASLSNERLKIAINSICSGTSLLPVSLDAYDLDGMAGIYIPGSINRDAGKQSADQAISTLGLTSIDPSLGAQAASAGIQAAKSLLSKKVKLVKVSIEAGYRVLLKDNNQK